MWGSSWSSAAWICGLGEHKSSPPLLFPARHMDAGAGTPPRSCLNCLPKQTPLEKTGLKWNEAHNERRDAVRRAPQSHPGGTVEILQVPPKRCREAEEIKENQKAEQKGFV